MSDPTSLANVAVLGLGTMGGPMAANLLTAGYTVAVYNRSPARAKPLAERGARVAATPAAAVRGATIVVVCVSDTPDVEAVVFGGSDAAIEGMEDGDLLIDCSTISPAATRDFAARMARRGVAWVDAPVSGGPEGAIAGTLAMMCGGSAADFERALPVLEVLGARAVHVGAVGAGQVTKAVNQIVISGTYQALAEALVFAAKAGIDPARARDAIAGGAARSWILENRSGHMIDDAYPLGFKLSLHRKDLGIALATANACGAAVPLTELVAAIEDRLIEGGEGDEDVSVLARAARQASDLPPGPLRKGTA